MAKKTRRDVLKGLAFTLPAAWATPVVKSVVLPAHAQATRCDGPQGCYQYTIEGGGVLAWPGGTGPTSAPYWTGASACPSSEPSGFAIVVVAASSEEAASLLGCTPVAMFATTPALPGGCNFYYCLDL